MAKVYEGFIERGGHGVRIVETGNIPEASRSTRALPHHEKHSPTGFSWGYGGSGPAELARCILLDTLGDAALCPLCNGTGTIEADLSDISRSDIELHAPIERCRCYGCDGGYLLKPGVYQEFKFQVVAAFPMGEPWRIPAVLVVAWLDALGVRGDDDQMWVARKVALMDTHEELRADG